MRTPCSAALLAALWMAPARGADPRYVQDFEFLQKTVASEGAAVHSKKIDWRAACERLRPAFETAATDLEHTRNVMRLLAVLQDSHTSVTRTSVDWKELPSKWDGLYGGGIWFAWDEGRVVLRGILPGHPLAANLPLGSVLIEVDGTPAWIVLERERRRIAEHSGISSDHSIFASMGNRLLPFGDRQTLAAKLLTPKGEPREVQVPRWGPGGKAFSPSSVQLPEGLEWQEGAVSKMLSFPWCAKVGYLRITGSMDEASVAAFHRAFDALKGMEALLLDCRGMGGGGDDPAWQMAGRLFSKPTVNGPGRTLQPTGSWQFPGPVVMLQDELEVSSAETFTWAVSETERVVSVGRPTGGWAIIPRPFKCPSGLVDFRLGVTDRPTPIRRVKTEGIGWPPDLAVPRGPVLGSVPDPDREVGLAVLAFLHSGASRTAAIDLFGRLLAGDQKGFSTAAAKAAKKIPGWDVERLAKLAADDLPAAIAMEALLLDGKEIQAPDALGARARLDDLLARAKVARRTTEALALKKLVEKAKGEAAAQEELVAMIRSGTDGDAAARKTFLRRHGKTRLGQYAGTTLWK